MADTQYMALIREFLGIIAADEQVKAKTANKDISFQIDLKDSNESFYIYFNHGAVEAAPGAYPGTASVKLSMDSEVFDGLMLGSVNGAKAAMSGKMSFAGDVRKAMGMQSILNLMMKSYQAAIDKAGKADAAATPVAPAVPAASAATAAPAGDNYMALIKEFLSIIAGDAEVKKKTATKDISFQIDLKDIDESFYIYFNHGEVEAAPGAYPGTASVKLGMAVEIFDSLMLGSVNGAKAAMSGKMSFAGDMRKAISMQSILNLMMKSYKAAMEKMSKAEASAPAPAPAAAAASAVAPLSIPLTFTQPEPQKKSLLGRLFGRTVVQQVIVQQVVVQQVIVQQQKGA